MSTNHTKNYSLCQWEAEDQVLRADFNGDNAKLEAALSAMSERMDKIDRRSFELAYNLGMLGLLDYTTRKKRLSGRSYFCENFQGSYDYTLSGGARITSGGLEFTGADGEAVSCPIGMSAWNWTTAVMVVNTERSVNVYLNGQPMQEKQTMPIQWLAFGTDGLDQIFTIERPKGFLNAEFGFRPNIKSYPFTVYGYHVFFF